MKFRRSVKGHFLGNASRTNEHGIRSAEGAERTEINHEVVIVTRSKTSGVTAGSSAAKFLQRKNVPTSGQSTVESHNRALDADSRYQAAGLEQQSVQFTCDIQPSMSLGKSAFESKQWQA